MAGAPGRGPGEFASRRLRDPCCRFDTYLERVRVHGIDILENRSRVKGEGRSIYFYDHDNHLFELHTGTLEQRLERYGEGLGP